MILASILIEYNVKSLDKTFDYIVPSNLVSVIKVGSKVLVPFGRMFVEGFVLKLSSNIIGPPEDPPSVLHKWINLLFNIFFNIPEFIAAFSPFG